MSRPRRKQNHLAEKPITEIARFLQTLRDCPCTLMKHGQNIKVQRVVWEREGHSCPSMDNPKILPTAGFFGNKRINGIARLCRQEEKQFHSVKSSFILFIAGCEEHILPVYSTTIVESGPCCESQYLPTMPNSLNWLFPR